MRNLNTMELEVFITLEDDGTYDVDVFDIKENERDENLTAGHFTLDQAQAYVAELKDSGHIVEFGGIR